MAKRLNKNLVIGLAVLGFALMTAVAVLMVYQLRQRDPSEFEQRAAEFADQGDFKRAAILYRQAYNASKQASYLVRAGDMIYKQGEELEALEIYRNAVVIEPTLLDAQEKILSLQLELADMNPRSTEAWHSVKSTAEAILELEGQEAHPEATYGMGVALLGLKQENPANEAEGVRYLEEAVKIAPQHVEAVGRLADYYTAKGRLEEAEAIHRKLVEQHPEPGESAARARVIFAEHWEEREALDEALGLYEQAVDMAGDNAEAKADALASLAGYWMKRWFEASRGLEARGASEEERAEAAEYHANAVAAFRKSIEIAPEGFKSYLLLADMLRKNDKPEEAIEVLEQRLALPFSREGLKTFTTRVNRYNILINTADIYVTLAAEAEAGSEERDELVRQADMHVEDAFGEIPSGWQASSLRGKLHYVQGKFREAARWFEQAEAQSRGTNWVNLNYLALARFNLGQLGAAREASLGAISDPSAPATCWVTYARILIALDQPNEAITAINQVLQRMPRHPEALLIKAAAQEKLGQLANAGNTIGMIAGNSPTLISARAQNLARQGRAEEGLAMALEALAQDPGDTTLVKAAVAIYESMDRTEEARRLVSEALAASPNDFDLKMIQLQISDLSPEERQSAYLEMINEIDDAYLRAIRLARYHENNDAKEQAYEELAAAKEMIINRETPGARDAGESALRSIIDRMIDIAATARDGERLDALVEQATVLNLDAADGLSYRGRRLMVDGYIANEKAAEAAKEGNNSEAERLRAEANRRYEEAIQALKEALEKYPTSGQTHAQLGEAYFQTGRWDEAKIAFEKANDILPRNPGILKRLTGMALARGNDSEYKAWLEQCQAVMPDDPWVVERLLIAEEEKDPREGIARREQIREQDPEDLPNLYKLAQLYQIVGDFEKSEQRIEEMIQVRADNEVLAMAAKVLRDIGKPQRALQLLEQNVREAPPEDKAAAQLLIGGHYASLQDPAADSAYLAAADIDPSQRVCVEIGTYFMATGRNEQALEWFEKAHARAVASDSVETASIERMRIEALIRLGRIPEARELVDSYQDEYPEDPSGIYLASQVDAAAGDIDEAIAKLGRFLEKKPNHPLGLFRRAQYRKSLVEWQPAIVDLETLRATSPTALNFAPRILLAEAYEKVGRTDLALQELEGIVSEHPDAENVVSELIDLYMRNKRFTEAGRVLTSMLNRQPNSVRWLSRVGEVALAQSAESKAVGNLQQATALANQAVANIKKAAALSGYAPSVTMLLLDAYQQTNAIRDGIDFYETTVPPDRRTPPVLVGYANLLAADGNIADAVTNYRVALYRGGFRSIELLQRLAQTILMNLGRDADEHFRNQPVDSLFERANQHIISMIHELRGESAESMAICQELVKTAETPEEKATLLLRIATGYEAVEGDLQKARELYEQVLEIDPKNLHALNNLAYLLADKLNEPEAAIPYARRAVQVSGEPAVLDTLGWAYVLAGKQREAIAELTKARGIDEGYVPVSFHLAEAYRRDGQFENAVKLYTEILKHPQTGPFAEYQKLAEDALPKAEARDSG